ncbi:MAG TPA: hypothetical protein VGJ73_21195 [Verrucomicrobiae bacterium]|jgi:hypothetical protein
MIENFTPSEKARREGFRRNLMARGRMVSMDCSDITIQAIVQDAQQLTDENRPAKQKKSVYAVVTILSGIVPDPRDVGCFTEVKTGKEYKVLWYDETTGDRVTWKFQCEAQRENYEADQQQNAPGF